MKQFCRSSESLFICLAHLIPGYQVGCAARGCFDRVLIQRERRRGIDSANTFGIRISVFIASLWAERFWALPARKRPAPDEVLNCYLSDQDRTSGSRFATDSYCEIRSAPTKCDEGSNRTLFPAKVTAWLRCDARPYALYASCCELTLQAKCAVLVGLVAADGGRPSTTAKPVPFRARVCGRARLPTSLLLTARSATVTTARPDTEVQVTGGKHLADWQPPISRFAIDRLSNGYLADCIRSATKGPPSRCGRSLAA